MKLLTAALFAAALAGTPTLAHAQLGKAVREGAEALGRKLFSRSAREGTQEGAEITARSSARLLTREGTQEAAEAITRRTGAQLSDDTLRAMQLHGSAIVTPLVERFGDDGARAVANLSAVNARRMAIVADDLASSGRGVEYMKLLASHGDLAAQWIWENKGSLAVGTTAFAVALAPQDFIEASQAVVTAAIETTGDAVAAPLIEGTTEHVAPVIVDRVVTPVMAELAPPLAYVTLAAMIASTVALVWHVRRRWRAYAPPRR